MPEIPILSWYDHKILKDEGLLDGLREHFIKERKESTKSFVTVRYGSNWADKLNPGDKVRIALIDHKTLKYTDFLGVAVVKMVEKVLFGSLKNRDLAKNIGAKNIKKAKEDLVMVYDCYISIGTTVSIIDLVPMLNANGEELGGKFF